MHLKVQPVERHENDQSQDEDGGHGSHPAPGSKPVDDKSQQAVDDDTAQHVTAGIAVAAGSLEKVREAWAVALAQAGRNAGMEQQVFVDDLERGGDRKREQRQDVASKP